MKRTLKFRNDGSFKIVQFSDVEFIDQNDWDPETPKLDQQTYMTMERIIDLEKPDLIVFSGDVIASARARDPLTSFCNAVSVAEKKGIPWATVFGNHDSEGSVTRKQMHEAQLQHDYCVAEPDPPNISGVGNFALKVKDGINRAQAVLYFLDSGKDKVETDQIDWYRSKSREFTKQNGGEPLPSLAFFHIPIPEYKEVWDSHVCHGYRTEKVSSPAVNTGLFSALVEMGGVMGTFVGHDHSNDFWGELQGIRLCYGRSTRYVSYIDGVRNDRFPTGARIVELKAGQRHFDTWIRTGDGSVIINQPLHYPEKKKVDQD